MKTFKQKIISFVFIFSVFAVLATLAFLRIRTSTQQNNLLQRPDRSQITLRFSRQANPESLTLHAELVNTDASRTLGLSGREHIGSDGMLFVFPKALKYRFWMKEMKFDLDMIWLEKGKVVDISKNVPAPANIYDLNLPNYGPTQPVSMVLEVPAGSAQNWNIQTGDSFEVE